MVLIKKVVKYLLANPLYAVVVAVCCVAIFAVVIALCVKASKSKKSNAQTTLTKNAVEIENATMKEQKPVLVEPKHEEVAQVAPISEQSLPTEEKVSEPSYATVTTPKKEEPAVKTEPVKAEKKESKIEKKADTPVAKPKKLASAPKSDPILQDEVIPPSTTLPTKEESEVSETVIVANEQSAETTTKKSKRYNGKWVIWRLITKNSDDNQEGEESYFFELLASNGEKLLSSEEYTSFAGAQKGIQTHKANILKNNFRICLTKKGDYIFKLLNGKNFLLCMGENYPTKARCESAIESTKRFAQTAVIDENIHDHLVKVPAEDETEVLPLPDGYNGKWIIDSYVGADGEKVFYFELFANNGEKLLSSEEYTTYIGAVNGIQTHKNNIAKGNFRVSLTKRGDYIYKLLNGNGQLLCLGEHYKTKRRCLNAVESVKRFAANSPVLTDSAHMK